MKATKEGAEEESKGIALQFKMQAAMKGLFAGTAQKQYEKLQRLNFNIFASIRFNMIRYLPKALQCCCLRQSMNDSLFQHAFTKLREEINLINLLKEVRVTKAAI